MKKNLMFLVLFLTLISSTSNRNHVNKNKLIGIWSIQDCTIVDDISCFKKVKNFNNDLPAIEFKKNGELIKRQNSGSCGTPPISFANYDGNWKITSKNTLTIRYAFFDGIMEEDWKIIESDKNSLKIIVLVTRTKSKNSVLQLKN